MNKALPALAYCASEGDSSGTARCHKSSLPLSSTQFNICARTEANCHFQLFRFSNELLDHNWFKFFLAIPGESAACSIDCYMTTGVPKVQKVHISALMQAWLRDGQ
jgi:hypothetical protein